MPAPIYLTLTSEQDQSLLRLSRQRDLDARTRARVEALRLSGKHWQAQQVAAHLGLHVQTVRRAYDRFLTGGPDGLLPKEGRKRQPIITGEMRDHLRAVLEANAQSEQPRTYTAPELAVVLEEGFGLVVHRETVRRVMASLGYAYKRTRHIPASRPNEVAYRETADRLEGVQAGGQPAKRA